MREIGHDAPRVNTRGEPNARSRTRPASGQVRQTAHPRRFDRCERAIVDRGESRLESPVPTVTHAHRPCRVGVRSRQLSLGSVLRHCEAKPGAGGLPSGVTIPASPLGGSTLRATSRRLSASTVNSARSVPSESPVSASRSRSKTAPANACRRSASTGAVRSSVTAPGCPDGGWDARTLR